MLIVYFHSMIVEVFLTLSLAIFCTSLLLLKIHRRRYALNFNLVIFRRAGSLASSCGVPTSTVSLEENEKESASKWCTLVNYTLVLFDSDDVLTLVQVKDIDIHRWTSSVGYHRTQSIDSIKHNIEVSQGQSNQILFALAFVVYVERLQINLVVICWQITLSAINYVHGVF